MVVHNKMTYGHNDRKNAYIKLTIWHNIKTFGHNDKLNAHNKFINDST